MPRSTRVRRISTTSKNAYSDAMDDLETYWKELHQGRNDGNRGRQGGLRWNDVALIEEKRVAELLLPRRLDQRPEGAAERSPHRDGGSRHRARNPSGSNRSRHSQIDPPATPRRGSSCGRTTQRRPERDRGPCSRRLASDFLHHRRGGLVGVDSRLPILATISKPVAQLENAARSIAAGDLGARVDVASNDELGDSPPRSITWPGNWHPPRCRSAI
jgi:methyl-accepting chemotaxis protein